MTQFNAPLPNADPEKMLTEALRRIRAHVRRHRRIEKRLDSLELFEDQIYEWEDTTKPIGEKMRQVMRYKSKREARDHPLIQMIIERRDRYEFCRTAAARALEEGDLRTAGQFEAMADKHLTAAQLSQKALLDHEGKHVLMLQKMLGDAARISAQLHIHQDQMKLKRGDNPEEHTNEELEAEILKLETEYGKEEE